MRVRQVEPTSRRDVRRFIQFPFALYRGCPQWVPPMIADMRVAFDHRRHIFYRHSEAAFYLAEGEGEVLGRLAVLDNRHYNDYHGSQVANFYFFDAVNDVAVAHALFEAAFAWARRRGLNKIIGPKGMLRGDGLGLLVEGCEHRPAMGIPYNYDYYDHLVTSLGFEKEIDYLSAYVSAEYHLPPRVYDLAERVKQRRAFSIREFASKAELSAWIPAIKRVNNEAFTEVWGYYPINDDEINAAGQRMLAVADHRLIKLVMKEDKVVGFLLTFHDLSAGLQKAKGRIWPLGWYYLWREFKRTEWANLNGIGLLPQHQGVGANAILYTELEKSFRQFGFRHADFVQVSEENVKSLSEVSFVTTNWYKRHRIYRRDI